MEKVKQMAIAAVGRMVSLERTVLGADSCAVGERREPGGEQRGQGAMTAPQGRYQSLGQSMGGGMAQHCSVLPSASLPAAWSLDLLPGQVKPCCLP